MDRILINSPTTQTGKDDIIQSIDNNQYLIMEDLSASSLNHKARTYTSLHCANNISQCPSTSESTSEAKLVRKKGRPPKAGKQVADIFNCNVCTKTFNNSSGLVKHYVTHSAERKFVCSECSKTFKRQDHLTGHMLTHSDVKPFVCQKCAKSYCDSRSLKRHIELYHHSECSEIISSSQTDALLKNSSISEPYLHVAPLVSMMRDEFHEDVECFPESSCSTLQMHLCRICGHTFKSMQALNGHMRFHTNSTLKKDDEQTNSGASNQDIEASFHDSTLNLKSYVPICSSKILLMQREKSSNNMSLSSKQDKQSDNFSASLFPSAVFSNNMNCIASTSTFSSPPSCGSRIEKLAEMESIIFADKQQQSFILETDQLNQSYSMQLQNLAQNIKPGLLLHQQQSKQFPKILNLNQVRLNTSLNRRHNTSYTLLHSLLMQKNDKQQRLEQTSQTPKFPSLRSSIHSSQIHEVSDKDNDFSKEQELLISYSEDVNFEGLGLDSDGIEKLLVQTAIQDPKEEHEHIDENLIPEDLRNIPTHTLQLFSMSSSSRSGTPPPLFDRLGNEIRTDDLLNQEFSIAADEFEQGIEGTDIEDKDVEPVLLSYDNSSSLSTSCNERLMNNDIFSKIDSDHKDTSPTSKDKILEERFLNFSNKAGFEQLEINNIMDVSYPKKPSTESKNFEKFRNPGLLKMKRRHWPGPLIIPPSSANAGQNLYRGSSSSGSSNFAFQSRLRSPRIIPGSGSFDSSIPPPFNLPFVPYTPPPMLSPVRNASGLFCLIQAVLATQTPPGHKIHKIANSPDLFDGLVEEVVDGSAPDEPLASDIKPHINEGPEYQALIPDCEANHMSASKICDHAEMIWNPSTLQDVAENEVKAFLEFSSCAAIPFNGCNKELAFHILYLFDGDIKRACLAIMDPLLPTNHFMDDFKYSETSMWNPTEIDKFSCSMLKNNKDFFVISKEMGTKSCKECIEFYYVWKKVCSQENMRLKSLRRRNDNIYNNLRSKTTQQLTPIEHESNCTSEPIPSSIWKSSPIPESFHFPFIPIPESSQRQQNIKLSQNTSNPKRQSKQKVGNKSRRSRSKLLQISPMVTDPDTSTIFPCKICKKVFYKVKSRSAHMKTHRMQAKKPLPSPSFTYNHYNNFMQQQISPHDKILPERNM